MATVTGIQPVFEDAILPGYACYRMQQRIYPGAAPCTDSSIRGRLYPGIDDTILEYLDAFEDVFYERQLLAVMTGNTAVAAQVYIVAEKYRQLLLPEPWDIEEFKSQHLARYLESCRKFHGTIRGTGHIQQDCVRWQ